MASTFGVQDLLQDCATLSGCPAFSTTTRITLPQATYWLAQSARSLSALLRQKHAEDRSLLRVDILPTQANYRNVSLPSDCGEVHAVTWQRDVNDAVLLVAAQQDDLANTTATDAWTNCGSIPRYRLEGNALAFYPPSADSESITVFYTTHISTAFATIEAQLDFDRWVTLDVCIKIATAKQKLDIAQQFQQQKALLENDLLARARKRAPNETHRIRDVRCMGRGWRY